MFIPDWQSQVQDFSFAGPTTFYHSSFGDRLQKGPKRGEAPCSEVQDDGVGVWREGVQASPATPTENRGRPVSA